MNTFEKLKAKRSALRGSITKFIAKTESILDSSVEDTDSDEILELLEHINKKENDLNIVNSEIEIAITDPTVFDNEFKTSEEYSDKITIIKFRIKSRIQKLNALDNNVVEKRENRPSQSACLKLPKLSIKPFYASSENKTLNIRILLDSGSKRTFILREVAEALNLKPIRKERLLLYSFGKKNPEPSDFDLVQLQLKNPHNPNHRIPIEALITQHISGASLDSRFLVNKIKMLAEVSGLEPADSGKGKIQLLLGMDFFCEVIRGAPVRITKGLFAQKSLFGNIICGALPNMTSKKSSACFGVSVEDDLNQHLRTLWEIESIGCDTAQETKHDSEFIKEFENNLTFADDWRHCDGKLNPADLITRGCDAEELLYSTHWFCGPPFLSLPEEKWPISKLPPSKTIEGQSERRSKIEISLHCATEKNENGREPVLKFENYSSWERFRRLTAWIQRFCRNARKVKDHDSGELSAEELEVTYSAIDSSCYSEERMGTQQPTESEFDSDFSLTGPQNLHFVLRNIMNRKNPTVDNLMNHRNHEKVNKNILEILDEKFTTAKKRTYR
ncbi:DUF1758 domain-containing protein [Nephila pilipes]|uniref:DUF1758 domain-containing protein n=1 Tax=Nephila pilipes TaxID=299642 RepID=A0A8X6PPD1_NEPPI|nr:DUF1758 domain-containing protein [Nephila pilipes]